MRKMKSAENKFLSKHKNGKPKNKVFGPIPNLEEHLRPDWWRRIFNSVYLRTDSDVIEDKDLTAKEADLFLGILKPSFEDRILDLCCGHGRHCLEFSRRGFKFIEGLDRSRYLIQKAKHCAQKENSNVIFTEGDARKLPFSPDTFDIVTILGNSFGYFETMNDDLRVLNEIFRVLKPGGGVLVDVADGQFIRNNFQKRSWEWLDKKHFVCRERSLSQSGERLISREVVSHIQKGVIADQFYAERLYTKETLSRLLEIAGFCDITFYDEIITDSKRNQDLGMMERRLLVSAISGRGLPCAKKAFKKTKIKTKVAVIFGDPSKKDILKPDAVFDYDDMDTIRRLKSALKNLSEYEFAYFDSHDMLVNELLELKGGADYVFNLCDEGFNNEASFELHIPALLEIIGMHYTGSGPKCLAFCYDKSLVRGVAKEMGIPVPGL